MPFGTAHVVVGATLMKRFNNKWYLGEVTETWTEHGVQVAHVKYEDEGM